MNRQLFQRAFRRLRPVALNIGLVCGSLFVALLAAEAFVRIAAPQQLILIRPDLWQPADTVGWIHRPNADIRINTGERTVSVLTDDEGFRVGQGAPRTGGREVLLLGDSFMEALQVEHEESMAGLLEAGLAGVLGEPVSVRNAGMGGWDPDQYALRARSLLASRSYDLVITAVYLGNDVIPTRREYVPPREPVQRYHFRIPEGLSRRALTDALLRPFNDALEVRSHLYVFFKNRMQSVRMEVGLAALTFPPQFLVSEANTRRWEVTADLCAEIAELAARHRAEAMFLLIPASFQVDSADLQTYVRGYDLDPSTFDLNQPNRRLGEELAARDLRVLDPLQAFRLAHGEGQRLYGSVDRHFSPVGHELLAELVTPEAARLLLPNDSPDDGRSGR